MKQGARWKSVHRGIEVSMELEEHLSENVYTWWFLPESRVSGSIF